MKERSLPVQSRLKETQASKLQEIANEKGLSVSLLIRMILIKYLEKRDV